MGAMCSQSSENPTAVQSRTDGDKRDPFSALPANKFTLNQSKLQDNPYDFKDELYFEWIEKERKEEERLAKENIHKHVLEH